MREIRSGTSMGSSDDLGVHFGLGNETIVATTVRWPDGTEETIDLTLDRWHVCDRDPSFTP